MAAHADNIMGPQICRPISFRGIELGSEMTQSDVRVRFNETRPLKCSDECFVSDNETLAGVRVTMVVTLKHGRLVHIMAVFDPTKYERIASEIVSEFGRPWVDSSWMHDGVERRMATWDDAAGNGVMMEQRPLYEPDFGLLSFRAKDGGL